MCPTKAILSVSPVRLAHHTTVIANSQTRAISYASHSLNKFIPHSLHQPSTTPLTPLIAKPRSDRRFQSHSQPQPRKSSEMLHHAHHLPNRLLQPRAYFRHNYLPTPQPVFEPNAFASQLDEIDHLLHAFRLQRQRQSVYTWMPADEDTDEKMVDSESDGESGRRWSDSTESKDGGAGAVSDSLGLEDAGSLVRGVGAETLGGTPVGGVRDEGLGFGLGLLCLKLPDGSLATLPEEGGLQEEPRLVGRAEVWKSRLDIEALSQQIVSQGDDGYSFPSGVDGRSNESKSGKGTHVLPGLETAVENAELALVRRVTFILPMVNEEGNERDDEDTPGWTEKRCRVDT